MKSRKNGTAGLDYIAPSIFSSSVIAGFSTRDGGFSEGHLSTLNLSYSVNDDRAVVDENRQAFFGKFGIRATELATAGQVHGTRVVEVTSPGFVVDCDGLVTDQRDIFLCITAADCAAVLIADQENGVVGACHAGWRGAIGGIVANTMHLMEKIGANRQLLRAFIGPCISKDHFEVGEEVAEQFPDSVVDRTYTKPHVDLKEFLRANLEEGGLDSERIELSAHCTFRDSLRFYSHRAHSGKTGRMIGFVGLR